MSERLFGRPDAARKSVVREGRNDRVAPASSATGSGGLAGMLKPYKTYIILGVAMLAVAIAYQLYSRRASQKKTEEQVAAGLSAIEQQQGSGRPPLQVDPQVIEVLQNQVHSYQEQVAELEEALSRSNQQMRQLLASRAAPQMDPVAAQMMATRTQDTQQAPPEYSGLHGQIPPQFPSGPAGMMGGSVQMGQGMPGAQMPGAYSPHPHPSQMPPPPQQGHGHPGGPMSGGGQMNYDPRMNMQMQQQQGQQNVGMGAFASGGGGGGEPMPAIGGMAGHMGGSDFTPLPQDQGGFGGGGGHGASPGARMM